MGNLTRQSRERHSLCHSDDHMSVGVIDNVPFQIERYSHHLHSVYDPCGRGVVVDHLQWRRTLPLRRWCCSSHAFSQQNPRHFFPEYHEVQRTHPQGVVLQCRAVKQIIGRMTKELTVLAPFTMKLRVVAPTRNGLEDLSCLRAPRRKHHRCRHYTLPLR